jgi:hypothetical protein
MSVFMMCERALGLINASDLRDLDSEGGHKAMLEKLDYDGLVNDHAQKEAVVCARHFAGVRDGLLISHPWVFARKSAAPAQLGGTAPAGWKASYSLPADCLKALAVTRAEGESRGAAPPESEFMWRRSLFRHYEVIGRVLAANVSPLFLTYTAKVTDTNLWDGAFADAFCALLAVEIGGQIGGAPQLISLAAQRAAAAIQAARSARLIADAAQPPFEMPGYLDYSGVLS